MKFGDGIDWAKEARRAAAESAAGAEPGELLDALCWALGPTRGRIVDAGCNIGNFCPQFSRARFSYVGVDQSQDALAIAQQRYPGIHFHQAFLWDDWPASLGTFDAAVCNAVLQHNLHAEKERILPRIAQAVKFGGYFAMQESTVCVETATQLPQERWVSIVEKHGFKLMKTWHPNELGIHDGYLFKRA